MKRYSLVFLLGSLLLTGCKHRNDAQNILSEAEKNVVGEAIIDESSNFDETTKLSKIYKVYINPSVQVNNTYTGGYGSEAQNMCDIASLIIADLAKNPYIDVKGNCAANGLSLSQSIKESNEFSPDIHFALHSNAGGGRGSEIFYAGSRFFAQTILDNFLSLGDFVNRGVKDGNHLYEVRSSNAPAVALMEFLFHDNYEEATFIYNNKPAIATKMVEAIEKYLLSID